MSRSRRPSAQTIAVLVTLAETPDDWRYGYELCRSLGIRAGSMYPILIRLADRGLLETAWESDAPPGRPPRHMYRLTGPGLALAADLTGQAGQRSDAAAPAEAGLRLGWEGA